MSPQPLVKSINTIRCLNPRIFGEKAYKFRVLEEIIELKKVSVPDIRRLQEGSGQGIYPTISSVITMELKDGDLFKTFQHSET